ncbi:unnamed protein product [Caenorhabditis angaria]|uniref:Neurotransmitter-gated ion-channel ligand-binding domain-containing protein n=1 Tax=Caenorhabditis angaria TaxID=860376 RepID=A0A9P1ISD3_9PELO|nr:unnamed protein product [Caenorhabditis angaria]
MKNFLLLLATIFCFYVEGFIPKKLIKKSEAIDESLYSPRHYRYLDSHEEEVETDGQIIGDHTNAFDDPNGKLTEYIKNNSRKHIPLKSPHSRMNVYVSAGLYQIVDLDQKNNLATVSAYFDVHWYDEYLLWNSSDFGNIERIFVPIRWLWKPEFYMYHSVYGRVPDYAPDAAAEIHHTGRVRMFVSIASKSFCPINFKRFPFDNQTCTFSVSF